MKISYIILIGILSFGAYNAVAQNPQSIYINEDDSRVSIEFDKLEYHISDTIKLLITNISNDTLYIKNINYNSLCIKLKMKGKEVWEQLIIQHYSGGIFPDNLNPFLPQEQIVYQWNQKSLSTEKTPFTSEKVRKGVYRFEFYYYKADDKSDVYDNFMTVSNEFDIK